MTSAGPAVPLSEKGQRKWGRVPHPEYLESWVSIARKGLLGKSGERVGTDDGRDAMDGEARQHLPARDCARRDPSGQFITVHGLQQRHTMDWIPGERRIVLRLRKSAVAFNKNTEPLRSIQSLHLRVISMSYGARFPSTPYSRFQKQRI